MKRLTFLCLFIFVSLAMAGCQSSQLSKMQATNEALSNYIHVLQAQFTQQAAPLVKATQTSSINDSDIVVTTEVPLVSPNETTAGQSSVINSALIYSGAGTITPWNNKTAYPNALFGAANVHMICDPNGMADGKMYIDKETETATCGARGESWTPWKQGITVGNHYIYSSNANDKYEFWTVGTTPFTIRNTYSHSDFIFMIDRPGIYKLSANLIKGESHVYLTCQEAQNFDYLITQSSSYEIVLEPATCMLIIRDPEQAKTSKADIEVRMEFSR